MKAVRLVLFLFLTLALGPTAVAAIVADHNSVDAAIIPDSAVAAAANLRVHLRRASVGGNISAGLDALQAANARYDRSRWIFYSRGNPGWQAKVDEFVSFVAANAPSYDVFSMKFCYIDPDASFTYYRDAMLGLEGAYPGKVFVWWTMPIETSGNTARQTFNEQVRAYASANDRPLFDIADIEAYNAAGEHRVDSSGRELMWDVWTSDGGHLNTVGAERVASAWWWLMSRLTGWDPAGTPLLTIDDVSVAEGNSGTKTVTLTVRLSSASTSAVAVDWRTLGSGATDLSDKNAAPGTVALWEYLKSQYGTKMLSGAWTESLFGGASTAHSCSGEWPAIFGQDMNGWNLPRGSADYMAALQSELDEAKAAYARGEIVQINWHWQNPFQPDLPEGAWSSLTAEQWANITVPGTSAYDTMMEDLDWHIDNFLSRLVDAQGQPIPILFRPLHEIDGGWFWWTSPDGTQTAELWRILHNHITNTRGFHNLIWVYSAGIQPAYYEQNGGPWDEPFYAGAIAFRSNYYPGAAYVDIAGIDLYGWDYSGAGTSTQGYQGTYRDAFTCMQAVASGKMIALTEAGALPDPTKSFGGDPSFAPWLYALPWYQGDENNPCDWVSTSMNDSHVVNMNDLP